MTILLLGCFHRGGLDEDGIWICKKCNRRWFYSYLGGGGWVSIKSETLENYLRGNEAIPKVAADQGE